MITCGFLQTFLLFASLFLQSAHSACTAWGSPWIEKDSRTTITDLTLTVTGTAATISFAENNPTGPIFLLNYNGDAPQFPSSGFFSYFGSCSSTQCAVQVNRPMDYELTQKEVLVILCGASAVTITISIHDVNDNAPYFTQSQPRLEFRENEVGEIAGQVCGTDNDAIDRSSLSFSVTVNGNADSHFEMVSNTSSLPTTKCASVKVKTSLDFEEQTSYLLELHISDETKRSTQFVPLSVIDVADQPPQWLKFFPVISLPEDFQTGQVIRQYSARDGDLQLNSKIKYSIKGSEGLTIEIDSVTGELKLTAIVDRDIAGSEVLAWNFNITAVEVDESSEGIEESVILTFIDVNDNTPSITVDGLTEIEVLEGFTGDFDFGKIEVRDPDFGINGSYTAAIKFDDPSLPSDKLTIVSSSTGTAKGSQTTVYKIRCLDPGFLDYEKTERQQIHFQVEVTEDGDAAHRNTKEFSITLKDINDNTPEFTNIPEGGYKASISESAEVNDVVDLTFEVIDRDVTPSFGTDSLSFSLVFAGTLEGKLAIDSKTGKIHITQKINREQIPEAVNVIVKLSDSLGLSGAKSVETNVEVTIVDVNDETPLLTLPTTAVSLKEGFGVDPPGDGEVLITGISAEDPDSNPDLYLFIDWETTRFYSGSSLVTPGGNFQYQNYFELLTEPVATNKVSGTIKVGKYRPDREVFDTVELSIKVVDENTSIDYSNSASKSGLIQLRILDLNDNPPDFVNPETTLSLTEELASGQRITQFRVQDKDLSQTVTLKLEDCTEPDLLAISGTDLVSSAPVDYEEVESIRCVVVATDNDENPLSRNLTVTVNIVDTNDNFPQWEKFSLVAPVRENTDTNVVIHKVSATDLDSGVYGKVTYVLPLQSNIDGGLDRFQIDKDTGDIFVKLNGDAILDFEQKSAYQLTIDAVDNYREGTAFGSNKNTTVITINLEDANDNPPVFQSQTASCAFSPQESVTSGAEIGLVTATDNDYLDDNKRITYTLKSVEAVYPTLQPSQDLFDVTTVTVDGKNSGRISVKAGVTNLLGFYGQYIITVKGEDHGSPRLTGEGQFLTCVKDVNDNKPIISFPIHSATYSVKESNPVNANVVIEVGNGLQRPLKVTATDLDTDENAEILYILVGGSGMNTFSLDAQTGQFKLLSQLDPTVTRKYTLQIRAKDQGVPQLSSDDLDFTLVVLSESNHLPAFTDKISMAHFLENEENLSSKFPEATDIDNNGLEPTDELYQEICYFIVGGAKDMFSIKDPRKPVLHNTITLDREDPAHQNLYVLVLVVDTGCATAPPDMPESDRDDQLRINIVIDDENDTPPSFDESLTAGLTPDYKNGDIVTTFVAKDPDLNDEITYEIVGNIEASDSSIQGYEKPFDLEGNTGVLKVLFSPSSSMRGFFSFRMSATDKAGAKGETQVKIYMVGYEHEYLMVFDNDIKEVEPKRNEIQEVFSKAINKRCNIQKVAPSSTSGIGNSSIVTSHFVDEEKNEPISKNEAHSLLSEGNLTIVIREELRQKHGLFLSGLDPKTDEPNVSEEIFMILFIVTACILGILVIAITAFHCTRVNSLKRQVKALATTQFGSQDSGLNRAGMALPNTNKFAEGANPVWNVDEKKIQSDNASLSSGDSVLIGVEDNPEFKNYQSGNTAHNNRPKNPLYGNHHEDFNGNVNAGFDLDADLSDADDDFINVNFSFGKTRTEL